MEILRAYNNIKLIKMKCNYWEFSVIIHSSWVVLEWTILMHWKRVDLSSIDILGTKFSLQQFKEEMDFFFELKRHIILAMLWRIHRYQEEEQEVYESSYPIESLPLSERTRNALIKNGILYVKDLRERKIKYLRWIWKVAIEEVEKALKDFNF